jgi:acylphosphatase
MITRKLIVQGRVQGVGFRYFAGRIAEAFDITGYVRNMADGSVEIVASGEPGNFRSFREQIEIGPDGGRVDRLVVDELEPARFDRFEVRR